MHKSIYLPFYWSALKRPCPCTVRGPAFGWCGHSAILVKSFKGFR